MFWGKSVVSGGVGVPAGRSILWVQQEEEGPGRGHGWVGRGGLSEADPVTGTLLKLCVFE